VALAAGTRLGPYEILAPIGAGGMGEVYRAKDTNLKRDVALKVLPEAFAADPERMARFQREAEVLASLNHPNISQIYGVEDRALVMELVEGESPKGPMPLDEAWKIASQMVDALAYAHEKGVVHRDLKPANVKVTPDGAVKLLDFGLAKAFSDAPDSASGDVANSPTLTMGATVAGVILGTAAYMAPEQARGKPVDKRADIWSFGVVIYELLTGQTPFAGDTISDTLAAVLKTEPPLEKVPEKARRLLSSCLQKDPRKRLQAIADWELLAETAPSLRTRSRALHHLWLAVAAVASFVAFAFGILYWRQASPEVAVLRYTLPPPEKSTVEGFAISPDSRLLAVSARRGGKLSLWVRPLDSLQYRALPGTDDAELPFWSPDDRWIGFLVGRKLRKIAVDGGPAQTLVDGVNPFGGMRNLLQKGTHRPPGKTAQSGACLGSSNECGGPIQCPNTIPSAGNPRKR